MGKFRARPVVVEAVQYDDTHGVVTSIQGLCYCAADRRGGPHVHTNRGPIQVVRGDWIVTRADGDRYPCKPNVFEATYERVMRPGEIGDEDG
jgi:hypothetical protein